MASPRTKWRGLRMLALPLLIIAMLAGAAAQSASAALPPPTLVQQGQTGLSLTPGDCPNVTACVYSNGDFQGYYGYYQVPGSAGTGGTAFEQIWFGDARSAKNNFANRIVVLAKGANHNNKYCIPAGQNRQGPFEACDYIRIGPAGSTC